MPRVCTICAHPLRVSIDKALVAGDTPRYVAQRFACSEDAARRHKRDHLPALLVKARRLENEAHVANLQAQASGRQAQEEAHALDVMEELQRCFARVNLLFDACDRWLRDPDDPTQYDIGPRAEDMTITYAEVGPDGKPVRRKARLSFLLARLDAEGAAVERWESKHADPRELVLKTAGQLHNQIELLAKLVGELDERPAVNVTLSPEWLTVRTALVETLAPFPDARAALAGALLKVEGSNGHG